jgi:glutamine synthetase
VELRAPDSACNPYLTFALLLAAGLEGVEKAYELPPGSEHDVSALSRDELEARGIEALPDSLAAAIARMESSQLVRETLGDGVFDYFLRNKRAEWDEYRRNVTQFELDRYLAIL